MICRLSKNISQPYFNQKESQTLYTSITTPSILIYLFLIIFNAYFIKHHGSGGSVGIATYYRLECPGGIPVGTRFSARPDRPWGPPNLLYNGYRVFPGGKVRPGPAADHSPYSSPVVMEEKNYTSTHPLGHTGPVTRSFYLFYCIKHHT